MSRILVVEPFKMLQQALAFALASEHEIHMTDRMPSDDFDRDVDVAIIDGAVMSAEKNESAERARRSGWHIPIVWLGSESPPAQMTSGPLVRLEPPFERDSLRRSLAEVLPTHAGIQKDLGNALAKAARAPKEKIAETPQRAGTDEGDKRAIIELTEVIEARPGAVAKAEPAKKN